jgi:hypothetical protein
MATRRRVEPTLEVEARGAQIASELELGFFAGRDPAEIVALALAIQADRIDDAVESLASSLQISRSEAVRAVQPLCQATGELIDFIARGLGYEGNYGEDLPDSLDELRPRSRSRRRSVRRRASIGR